MSQFDSILTSIQNEDYGTKKQFVEYLLRMVQEMQKNRQVLEDEDKTAILACLYGEVEGLLSVIPNTESYKAKDLLFVYEDVLLGLIMHLCPTSSDIPEEALNQIRGLVKLVEDERYFETAINELFKRNTIDEADIEQILSLAKQISDEYQKGMLYAGLAHYKNEIRKFSNGAKKLMTEYLAKEMARYLSQNSFSEELINTLEMVADVSKYFADAEVVAQLCEMLKLGYNNINYYATETLFTLGQEVAKEVMVSLAKDLEYAALAYAVLERYGKQSMFPEGLRTPEYLAKSDMVHWLVYPTELGKAPDEIEYIGQIKYLFRKEVSNYK